jgi:transcription elongation factor Elf1
MKLRERIKQQSKEVAEYMAKPHKYNVTWTCPHCGNCHSWWWEDEFEAHDDGEAIMTCDRCDTQTWCKGDGNGFYEPIEEERKAKFRRDLTEVNSSLDQLVTSRRMQFSMLEKLTSRVDDLESLEEDLHNYVRGLEDKVNNNNKLAFDAINTVTMRLVELEDKVAQQRSRPKKEGDVWDLINGPKKPFHQRIREGCQLEGMDGTTLASILRFIAVEVEKMLDRSSGGSYTINNFQVGEKLRVLADEAEIDDGLSDDDEKSPGWDLYGWEGDE